MTISDRGIGMTEATIRDYFLKAGASYRQSAEWKNTFEIDFQERNTSKVLRSGRFGVGALAAFLIGSKISVATRHISQTEGYFFEGVVEADIVELKKDNALKAGKQIKLFVNDAQYKKILKTSYSSKRPELWDWYCFKRPFVMRITPVFKKKGGVLINKWQIDLHDKGWRKLNADLPYTVFWSYDSAPSLTCNGIIISHSPLFGGIPNRCLKHWKGVKWDTGRRNKLSIIKHPNLVIIDPDGKFPLNLHRNSVQSEEYDFEDELALDIL